MNEDEGSYLDFKRDQYAFAFAGATDEQKGELIKDILAFANAWRRTDACILIGVEEVRGGRGVVHGVTAHLPEHALQQLVNSKTNRPIEFSYQIVTIDGKQVGVIHIPVQDRPFYLKTNFGKLTKGTVYVRRGSSTAEADADEIARMGAAHSTASQLPTLTLQFADVDTHEPRGRELALESSVLVMPERRQIPTAPLGPRSPLTFSIDSMEVNERYYRQYAEYLFIHRATIPACLLLNNTGTVLLKNPRLRAKLPYDDKFILLTESKIPDKPKYNFSLTPVDQSVFNEINESSWIIKRGKSYEMEIEFNDVQPKDKDVSKPLYIAAVVPMQLNFEAVIFADNLPDPVSTLLVITITCQRRQLSVQDLLREIGQDEREERKRLEKLLDEVEEDDEEEG